MTDDRLPANACNFEDIMGEADFSYRGSEEKFARCAEFALKLGLKSVGVNLAVLPPHHRSSWPHAHKIEEEFIYVIAGHPQLWQDGVIYPLKPGDGVAFPKDSGVVHTFINNSNESVKLLQVGENLESCRITYPLHPQHNQKMKDEGYLWEEHTYAPQGDHDGFPDQTRFRDEVVQKEN